MEHSSYYNKTTEYIIKQYLRRLHLRKIMSAIIICGDATIFYQLEVILDFFWWRIFILPVFISSLCLILYVIKVSNFRYFTSLSKILYYDCDPVKYEKVLKRLQVYDKKEKAQATLSLELAAAAFSQKCIVEGYQYLEQVTFRKFALYRELKRLNCYAAYYDLQDDFEGLHKTKRELCRLASDMKENSCFYRKIKNQIDLIEAMAARASENLEAQKQRWAMLYSMAENPLQENIFLMRLAKVEWNQGKRDVSMKHMRFVVAEGNTLFCAVEAMGLLNTCGDYDCSCD